MYLYDHIDQQLVDDARRPVPRPDAPLPRGRALRGRIPAAAPAERPVHPAPRADAARRDPLRHAVLDAAAQARAHRARATTAATGTSRTRQNLQFNWPRLEDVPDILAELATVRDARHPDLGQLHPQHHHRPLRRRRARRDRRSAPVWCELHPAVVDLPSGVRLPAAQVQDRRHRRGRPTAPRSWCTTSACTRVRERGRRGRASASSSAAAWAARRSSAT